MDFYYGIIPCYYVVAKDILDTLLGHTKPSKVKEAVIISTILPVLALVFICLIPFLLVYAFVHICLKLKHGHQYGGILASSDVIYEESDPKITMNLVLIVAHDGTEEKLVEDMKIACGRLHDSHYRFSSIVKSFCGYRYFLKNQIHIDEVVVPVRFTDSKYLTKDDLYKNLEKHQYQTKSGDKRLWELKICLQPILWNDESSVKKHYVVIYRQNHSICDGVSSIAFFKRYISCEPLEAPVLKKDDLAKIKAAQNKASASATIHKLPFGDVTDYHLKPIYEGSDHHFVFFHETHPKYLPILKRLKTMYNTSITDVVAAGATETISKYFQKESINQENIFFVSTCRSAKENIADILSGKVFGNESTGVVATLPLTPKSSAVEKLKEVSNASKKARLSVDRQCLYIAMKLANYLPAAVSAYVFDFARTTLAMTNLPLPDFARIGSSPLVDVFGFVNSFNQFKFTMAIMSHKGCISIGLTAKSGMVKTREQLQMMLDDTIRYIDRLNEESDSTISNVDLHTRSP